MQPAANEQFELNKTSTVITPNQRNLMAENKARALERLQQLSQKKRQFAEEEQKRQAEPQNKQLKSTNKPLTHEEEFSVIQQKMKAFKIQLFQIQQKIQRGVSGVRENPRPTPLSISARSEQNKQQALAKRELCRNKTERDKILGGLLNLAAEVINKFVLPLPHPTMHVWTPEKQKILEAYKRSLNPFSPTHKPTELVKGCPYLYYNISLPEALFREEISPLVREIYKKRQAIGYTSKFLINMAAVRIKYDGDFLPIHVSNSRFNHASGHSERLALCESINDAIGRKLDCFKDLPPLIIGGAMTDRLESLLAFIPYRPALSKCEVDIFSDRTPCHDPSGKTDRNDGPYDITCEVFFARILPNNSRIFFATPYITYKDNTNASEKMESDLRGQYDIFSKIQLEPLIVKLLQPEAAYKVPFANQVEPLALKSEDEGIFKQICIKDDEIMDELNNILLKIQGQASNIQSVEIAKSASSTENPIILPEPKEPVEGKFLQELAEAFSLGEPKFQTLLRNLDLIATQVKGSTLDCYIYSLLQHVTGQYDMSSFSAILIKQLKEAAELSTVPEMRYDDSLQTLKIVKAINKKYQVNLQIYCIQINNEGNPIMLPSVFDAGDENKKQPIVIWLQVNHYVCITSYKLKELIKNKLSSTSVANNLFTLDKQFSDKEQLVVGEIPQKPPTSFALFPSSKNLLSPKNLTDTVSPLVNILAKLSVVSEIYTHKAILHSIQDSYDGPETLANVIWHKIKENKNIQKEESQSFNDVFRNALSTTIADMGVEKKTKEEIATLLLQNWSLLVESCQKKAIELSKANTTTQKLG